MSERQQMLEDQDRQRVAAELANKQAREAQQRLASQTKPVDLQTQVASIKAMADKARADIQKIGTQTATIKESKAKIEGSIKRLESGIQSKENIDRIRKEIRVTQAKIKTATPKIPKQQPRPRGKGILNILDETANSLIKDANLKSLTEIKADITKFGGISAARANQPKPTAKEAKARLGLALIEPIIGGGKELLFPFANQLGQGRPETTGVRIVGALLTPTPADFAAGWILAKTGVTKAGRNLLKKLELYILDIGDPIFPKLTAKELDIVRQWEKMGHTPTSLRRSAQRNPDIITTIEEMAAFYEKNPAQFSAGASVIPEEIFIFNKVAYDFDMEPTELVNFIKKNPNLFADGTLLAAIIPTLSDADAAIVLEGATLFPPDLIDDTIERLREQTWSRQEPTLDDEEEQVQVVIPDIIQIPDVKPDVIPDVIPDETQIVISPTKQKVITEQLVDETVLTEVITTPTVILSKPQREKRNKINLSLFRGRKQKYRVTFFFTTKEKEIKIVEARSYPNAVNKAQRGRKPRKKQPKLIDIVKIK